MPIYDRATHEVYYRGEWWDISDYDEMLESDEYREEEEATKNEL